MQLNKVIQFVSLAKDINNQSFCFTSCIRCRRENPEHVILESMWKDKIEYTCSHCKLTQSIEVRSGMYRFYLLTKRQIDKAIIEIIQRKTDDPIICIPIIINNLIRYGKLPRFVKKEKPKRKEIVRKLKIHINEGLALPVKLIQEITGLSKKEIIELKK